MNKKLLNNLIDSKKSYRRMLTKLPYEEKIKIIIELQKINDEMRKRNPNRKSFFSQKAWQI